MGETSDIDNANEKDENTNQTNASIEKGSVGITVTHQESVENENAQQKNLITKRKRRGKPWGTKRRPVVGNQEEGDRKEGCVQVEKERTIGNPSELMEALLEKDKNLTYKMEGSGKNINYLDLDISVQEGTLRIDIHRKKTHVWDIPYWQSRTPTPHKKAAIFPLLLRAYRLLKNHSTQKEEIQKIFQRALLKGYPIRTLRRWNAEADKITNTLRNKEKKNKSYRNITSKLNSKIRKTLKPKGVEVVTRRDNTLFENLRTDKDRRGPTDTPG